MKSSIFSLITTKVIFVLTMVCSHNATAEIIRHPDFAYSDVPHFHIDSIKLSENDTRLYVTYYNIYGEGAWVNLDENMFLRNNNTNTIFKLSSSKGIPLSPKKHICRSFENKISSELLFPAMKHATSIDLIEKENDSTAFNIYGIELSHGGTALNYSKTHDISRLFNQADFYYQAKNYHKVIDIDKKNLDVCVSFYGKYSDYVATILMRMAVCANNIGDTLSSINFHKKYIDLEHYHHRTDNDFFFTFVESLSFMLYETGKVSEALSYLKEAISIEEKLYGFDSPKVVDSKKTLALWGDRIGDTNQTIQMLESIRKTKHKKDLEYIGTLQILAAKYQDKAQYNKAIEVLKEQCNVEIKNGVENTPGHIRTLYLLAGNHQNIRNNNKALEYYYEATKISRRINDVDSECMCLTPIATIYSNMGLFEKSISVLDTITFKIEKKYGKTSAQYAKCLETYTIWYVSEKQSGKALDYALKAKAILEDIGETQTSLYSSLLNNISSCYINIGEEKIAEDYHNQGRMIDNNFWGLLNHADYLSSNGDMESAITLCRDILDSIQNDDFSKMHTYIQLASIYNKVGNHEETIEYLTLAEGICEVIENGTCFHAELLCYISSIYGLYKADSKCLEYMDKAISIYEKMPEENIKYLQEVKCQRMLYSTFSQIGNIRNFDFGLYKEVWNTYKKEITNNFTFMTERQRDKFWRKKNANFLSPIQLALHYDKFDCPEILDLSYDYLLFSKYLVLNSFKEIENKIENSNDSLLIKEFQELRQCIEYISSNEAERREQNILRKIRQTNDSANGNYITWSDIQASLKDNDIAVEFYTTPDNDGKNEYNALIVRKGWKHPRIVCLSYIEDVYNNYPPNTLAIMWEEICSVGEIKQGENIFYSPTGILNNITTEHMQLNGKYISDLYNIYRVSSTKEITKNASEVKIEYATLYGGLIYDSDSIYDIEKDKCIKERSGVDYLPSTRIEVNQLEKIFNQYGIKCKVYTELQGTEESFKQLSNKTNGVIHVATHGRYIVDSVENSESTNAFGTSVLKKSQLILSGGNKTLTKSSLRNNEEDNVISAYEISQLNLKNTSLVVLSACQSGLGKITNEGVLGLQYGFKKAGANSILMTLDNVDDKATQILMVKFYEYLLSGKSKFDSLRGCHFNCVKRANNKSITSYVI